MKTKGNKLHTQATIFPLNRDTAGKAVQLSVQEEAGNLTIVGYRNPERKFLSERNSASIRHKDGWFLPESLFRSILLEVRKGEDDLTKKTYSSGPVTIKIGSVSGKNPELLIRGKKEERYRLSPNCIAELEERLDELADIMISLFECPIGHLAMASGADKGKNVSIHAMMGLEDGEVYRKVCLYIGEKYITQTSLNHVLRLIEKSEDESYWSGPFRIAPLKSERSGVQEVALVFYGDGEDEYLLHLSPDDVRLVRMAMAKAKNSLNTYDGRKFSMTAMVRKKIT